jgi:hypothetical protein
MPRDILDIGTPPGELFADSQHERWMRLALD